MTSPETDINKNRSSSFVISLESLRNFFGSGETKSYPFRKEQLQKLKNAVLKHEQDLYDALYTDLKKNKEEAWVTEIGFLIAEINAALKNLRSWMKPVQAKTNLVNFPSSSFVLHEPLGVVLIIGPWNYPLQLLFTPLVGAIAAGNCAVLKSSEFAPATSHIMKQIIKEAFPEEYVLFVEGDGREVISQMMNDFVFDHIFYTGGTEVGKIIYQLAAKELIPVTLELGGKSPAIVEPDADLISTAKRIVLGKYLNAGQTCIAPDYVLVHESVKNKLVDKIKAQIEKFYTSDAATSYDYSKIINERRFEKLLTYLSQGNIIAGGQHNQSTLFIAPTLMDDVSMDSPLMKEEIFGPILPVLSFTTIDEAVNIVQQNANPLAFYLFTSSKKKEKEWIKRVSFGGGCVNNADWHFTNHHLPFGGVGNSGFGSYHGKHTFETFTRAKPVMKTPAWFDPSIKYPPFKGKLKLFKWVIR